MSDTCISSSVSQQSSRGIFPYMPLYQKKKPVTDGLFRGTGRACFPVHFFRLVRKSSNPFPNIGRELVDTGRTVAKLRHRIHDLIVVVTELTAPVTGRGVAIHLVDPPSIDGLACVTVSVRLTVSAMPGISTAPGLRCKRCAQIPFRGYSLVFVHGLGFSCILLIFEERESLYKLKKKNRPSSLRGADLLQAASRIRGFFQLVDSHWIRVLLRPNDAVAALSPPGFSNGCDVGFPIPDCLVHLFPIPGTHHLIHIIGSASLSNEPLPFQVFDVCPMLLEERLNVWFCSGSLFHFGDWFVF